MFIMMGVVQPHRRAPIQSYKSPVEGLQRVVLQEGMILGNVAQVDRELQIWKEEEKEELLFNNSFTFPL